MLRLVHRVYRLDCHALKSRTSVASHQHLCFNSDVCSLAFHSDLPKVVVLPVGALRFSFSPKAAQSLAIVSRLVHSAARFAEYGTPNFRRMRCSTTAKHICDAAPTGVEKNHYTFRSGVAPHGGLSINYTLGRR